MIKETIKGYNNYDIPCLNSVTEGESKVVIISHGLNSSKESPTVKALMERLSFEGMGSYAYDYPAHGESPAEGEMFRIDNCLDDLSAAEARIAEIAPTAEIMYFSSSFGAYINLIYIAARRHAGKKTFLRAAAVNMPGIFKDGETPELTRQVERDGYFILDDKAFRPLKITKGFCGDLESYDVFKLYKAGMADVCMIHGDEDESASFEDARLFAEQSGACLTVVKGGKHRLAEAGQADLVMDKAIDFFKGGKR